MKVLLAGGGTAGHINPALAIAGYIKEKRPDTEILFHHQRLQARLQAQGYGGKHQNHPQNLQVLA